MRQVITATTRYAGPTNYKPSRVFVYIGARRYPYIVSWDHALDPRDNHIAAAVEATQRHTGETVSHLDTIFTLPDACRDIYVLRIALEEAS